MRIIKIYKMLNKRHKSKHKHKNKNKHNNEYK